jgi:hypothetical protein
MRLRYGCHDCAARQTIYFGASVERAEAQRLESVLTGPRKPAEKMK